MSGPQPPSSRLRGTPVVSGVAYGPVVLVSHQLDPEALAAGAARAPREPDAALAAFDSAAETVAAGFVARAAQADGAAAEVLTASAGLAKDKGLRGAVRKHLNSGEPLLDAVVGAVEDFAGIFSQMGGLMAERVTDLRDISLRVQATLAGVSAPGVPVLEAPSILLAEDLAPADTAGLDAEVVLALVTERGGSTSHTAIIARQMGIPCLVGVAGALELTSGARVLVDGAAGEVEIDPDPEDAESRVAADQEERALLESWSGPATTSDGSPVTLYANVADPESARSASEEPVAGVGLFRTELSFLNSLTEPSVDEQADLYAGVLAPFAGRRVVVRTLDAGSDKPIAYATHDGEENPALGVRGMRLAAENPGLMARQLDAVAIAADRTGTETWVMAPMVATADEAREFATQVRERGLRAGVMVEVPSAALLAHQLLQEVDFLSLGTNDLTQYTMAADRMATDLAHLTDPWQPAVLQLIAITAEAGLQAGKPVGVCGEAGADPLLACALVGMGVSSLSMAARAVRPVGARLAQVTRSQCEAAAEAALSARNPSEARAAVREELLDG